MVNDRDNSASAPEGGPWRKRVLPLRDIIGSFVARVQQNPVKNLTAFAAAVTGVLALAIGAQYIIALAGLEPPPAKEFSLDMALERLDEGFADQARELAVAVRRQGDLAPEEAGGPAYVLGAAMMADADATSSPRERRPMHLLAARYLDEAARLGFPPDRAAHGYFLLGRAHYETGRFPACLDPLQKALELHPDSATSVHRLLADAYLRDSNPQPEKAVEHIQKFLADPSIVGDEREQAIVTAAEVQLQLNRLDSARELLAQLPSDSRRFGRAQVLEGRMLLREGNELLENATLPSDVEAEARGKFESAKEALLNAQQLSPGDGEVVRKSSFLLGRIHRLLGDYPAAERAFSRTRRSSFDTPEGLAAGFEEADIQRLLGRDDEAIDGYGQVLRRAVDMPVYSNPWLSLTELKERSEAAFDDYFDSGDFDRAIRAANALAPLFSPAKALEFQAKAHRAQANRLRNLATKGAVVDEEMLAESHAAWRRAAELFEQLASRRFATRQYPDLLWTCAECYLNGHDYGRAARLLRTFLRNEIRRKHPPALTALGRANLANGLAEEALGPLMECVEFFPLDPHSYQARLLAALASLEIGDPTTAKKLLIENLENSSLTPRSPEWRESLYALGRIHYQEGLTLETRSRLDGVDRSIGDLKNPGMQSLEAAHDFLQDAISQLTEAVERDKLAGRDPSTTEAIQARYFIAESHRQAAKLPLRKLTAVTIETERDGLNEQIQGELALAAAHYQELQKLLNDKQETQPLDAVEKRIQRNTYFARGDVLYDLERYEDAIRAYASATNRYQHEPEALEAYVQIANCHRLLNRRPEARGTLEQAKVVLNRIRKDADFEKTTRYDREEWGRFLDWLTTM